MELSNKSAKVSVAERATWLRDIAESNRVKQQTLNPSNGQSTVRSHLLVRSSNKVSIKERVRLFESMATAPVVVVTTPERRQHQNDNISHPLQLPSNEVTPSSGSSSSSVMNVVEIVSSSDTNTSSTTSLSSSSEDNRIVPSHREEQLIPTIMVPEELEPEPEPLLGLPVTGVRKPISHRSFDEEIRISTTSDDETGDAIDHGASNVHEMKQSGARSDLMNDSFSLPGIKEEYKEDQDYDDNDSHIVKIVKIVDRSPPPLPRSLLSLPWDESDDFSDPWMTNQGTSILDLDRGTDSRKQAHYQQLEQQQQPHLPTTILNPSSLRSRRSLFVSNRAKVHQPGNIVFVDDDNEGEDDEDDIQTVDNSIVFRFNNDMNNTTTTAVNRPFTTSLSFDSTFSKKIVDVAPISPLQPPPISRYTNRSQRGATGDISHLLTMNWFDVPDKVCDSKADDTSRIDKKGLSRRIKPKSTNIPMLEMRKKTTSLLCSYKHNRHPLKPNDDIANRSKNTTADSNNDTTGLWFTKTFGNTNNDCDDDDLVNVPPSCLFPPSPLNIVPSNHAIRAVNDSNATSKKTNTKNSTEEQPSVRSQPIRFQSHCVSLDDYHVPKPRSNQNLQGVISGSTHSPSQQLTSAILGDIFAEEIAADTAAAKISSKIQIVPVKESPVSTSSIQSKHRHDVRSNSSVKSAFTSRSTSTTTVSSTMQSRYGGSSNDTVRSVDDTRSLSKFNPTTTEQQQPSKSDRITSTITQLCQNNKNSKFQKRSLVQIRKDQLATNLAKNRITNRISKGSWQKDTNGNFKRHFILVDEYQQQQQQQQQKTGL